MTLTEVFVNLKRVNVHECTVNMAPHDSFEKEPCKEGTGKEEGGKNGEKRQRELSKDKSRTVSRG